MIKEFVDAWEANKETLEGFFRTHKRGEYDTYKELVKLLFDIVINPHVGKNFNTNDIHIIDDGDYQGTLIFILHKNIYQPSVYDYVYLNVYYGSCSGCDTLQAIHQYDYNDLPNDQQVKDYMTLCLHLLQSCTYMVDGEEE